MHWFDFGFIAQIAGLTFVTMVAIGVIFIVPMALLGRPVAGGSLAQEVGQWLLLSAGLAVLVSVYLTVVSYVAFAMGYRRRIRQRRLAGLSAPGPSSRSPSHAPEKERRRRGGWRLWFAAILLLVLGVDMLTVGLTSRADRAGISYALAVVVLALSALCFRWAAKRRPARE